MDFADIFSVTSLRLEPLKLEGQITTFRKKLREHIYVFLFAPFCFRTSAIVIVQPNRVQYDIIYANSKPTFQ